MEQDNHVVVHSPQVTSPLQDYGSFLEEAKGKEVQASTWSPLEKAQGPEVGNWEHVDTTPRLSRKASSLSSSSTLSSPCSSDYAPTDSGSDASSQSGDSISGAWNYSAFEKLPVELLDSPPSTFGPRNEELVACLLTSRVISSTSMKMLYRHISIPHSRIFAKMLSNLQLHPELGTLVRRLNFCHYNSMGFGRTRRRSSEIQNITPDTLLQALNSFTHLREFLVHEHLDSELTSSVLLKLFSMPSLHALDFCACSSPTFVSGMSAAITNSLTLPNSLSNLTRLSLHECTTLQAPFFASLLPRLPHLTHLDVAHTLITDSALASIPSSARLTHLNLSRCTRILGANTVVFLTTHPAVRASLVSLNLTADPSRFRLLYAADVDELLPRLPATLRALELSGAKVNASHLPSLARLSAQLEELGIGYSELDAEQVGGLLVPQAQELDAPAPALRYVNFHGMEAMTPMAVAQLTCLLSSSSSSSSSQHQNKSKSKSKSKVSVLELDPAVFTPAYVRSHRRHHHSTLPSDGDTWVLQETGRRVSCVRVAGGGGGAGFNERDNKRDNGERKWKMGAREWGVRKVGVARMDGGSGAGGGGSGGVYGFYGCRR
ncbi:MAG: hypothetical protein Q9160_004897 [Pyrenula sp. 1 TL-2023]